jgi:hypothetical protein
LYFLHVSLPWFGTEPSINQQQRDTILEQQMCLPLKPDYAYLRKLFHDLLVREGHQYSHPFAWCIASNNLIAWMANASAKDNKHNVHYGERYGIW